MLEDGIAPMDTEGAYYLKTVPVIGAGLTVGSDEVAEKLPPPPRGHKVATVRGRGSFAVGQVPEEAFRWTSSLEASRKTPCPPRPLSPGGEKEGGATW